MLLHIRPRLYSPYRNVELIDLDIDPLGLHLRGGADLAARRPYPNRRYAVACRKRGLKAVDGILIETKEPLDVFHVTARWAVEAHRAVTHHVHYRLLDHDFDAASDDMFLWAAVALKIGKVADVEKWPMKWLDRSPAWAKTVRPIYATPVMEIHPSGEERPQTTDVIDIETGWIMTRSQVFEMPTIERGRITECSVRDRFPVIDMAFR